MSATIQSLPSSSRDASRLAARLGVPFHEIAIHTFPDGEMRVTVGAATSTTIIYASLDHPNDKLIALAFAAEALRRGGASRLVLVAPYLCYMRQDTAFREGEAISQKVIGPLLARYMDRVITVDAHLHRTPDIGAVFPGIESENLSAMPAISDVLRKTGVHPETIVAGPDAESLPWVSQLAGRLGLSFTVAQKARRGDRSVVIAFQNPAGIAGRPALTAGGATTIDAVVTHALFPEQLCREMTSSGIRSIRSTYSVSHSTNAIALDDLFVDALKGELTRADTSESCR
jgi:ribose-phosphate pyrophosphokinase